MLTDFCVGLTKKENNEFHEWVFAIILLHEQDLLFIKSSTSSSNGNSSESLYVPLHSNFFP